MTIFPLPSSDKEMRICGKFDQQSSWHLWQTQICISCRREHFHLMLSAFHGNEVQVNMMALPEMLIFTDIVDKKKVEKRCPVLVCFRHLVFGCFSYLCNIKSSFQCFWSLCVLFTVMPIVVTFSLPSAVRSTFPWSRHVWVHGEKSGFWSSCTQCRFSCSRSQRAHMPDVGNCSGFFVALLIKRICAIEQFICISDGAQEVWMQRETGSESKPIFQVLHHAATLGSFPKQCFQQMQNTYVGISKRKLLY